MGMGRYVKITGIIGGGKYAVKHEISGEIVYATIEKEFRGKFDPLNRDTPLEWCPFLMDKNDEGNYLCSIYSTAPKFCKNFRCCTCQIFDSEENPVGMVKGRATIVTEDNNLKALWEKAVADTVDLDAPDQKKRITGILKEEGYRVEYYE